MEGEKNFYEEEQDEIISGEASPARPLSADEEINVRRAVSLLRKPIVEMIKPMMEEIENGSYNLLIGDDASGRIPALIVRTVINSIYAKHGYPPIPTRFIAGSRRYNPTSRLFKEKKKEISEYITSLTASLPTIKRALVVTDTIDTGRSLLPLVESLREHEVVYDIATVAALYSDFDERISREEELGGRIFIGYDSLCAPSIYNRHEIGGVEKNQYQLHALTMEKSPDNFSDPVEVNQKVLIARNEAKHVAKEVLATLGVETKQPVYVDSSVESEEEELLTT